MNNKQLEISIVHDIKTAKKIWEEISPKQTIYDMWEFRFCFYKQCMFPIFFIVGKYLNKTVALLPLQKNTDKGCLEYFAGDYVDDNKIFITPEFKESTPLFYEAIKERAYLYNLAEDINIIKQLKFDHLVYTLHLEDIKDQSDFIEKYFVGSGKHLKKLKGELKKVLKNDIKVLKNNFSDIELFFKLKIKHFGADTCFNNKKERDSLIDLLKLDYDFHMFTFIVNGVKSGITIAILFKEQYFFLQSACDQESFPALTKYAFLKNIDEAIQLKARRLETSRGGENWKNRWNFLKIPQYSLKNF